MNCHEAARFALWACRRPHVTDQALPGFLRMHDPKRTHAGPRWGASRRRRLSFANGMVGLIFRVIGFCFVGQSLPRQNWNGCNPRHGSSRSSCGSTAAAHPGLRWAHNRIGDVSGRRPDCMLRRFCWTVGVIEHLFVERPQVKQYSPLL